ncbi:MAG: hypothetical protein ABL879_19135, partial [Devosia sp.]
MCFRPAVTPIFAAANPERMKIFLPFFASLLFLSMLARAQAPATLWDTANQQASVGKTIGENTATPVTRLKVPDGFKVELLYSVPSGQGSWINLCADDKGRIYTSDQHGGLYRFTPPPLGQALAPAKVEKVPAKIRAANGLLFAFGALYVSVNDYESKMQSGLYRVTDSDGDDQL